jgi:predicted metal-binding membrane protein
VLADRARSVGDRTLLASSALLFTASSAAAIHLCHSMSGGMAMPGDWTLSMAWMKMSDQTWPSAACSFIGMWEVMMVAMMLPSLVPMLLSHRRSVTAANETQLRQLTVLVAAGYFALWAVCGAAVYLVGVLLASIELHWSALATLVPAASGIVVLFAGALQLSPWKIRQLERCRNTPACVHTSPANPRSAWCHGLRISVRCILCCSSLMLLLLVAGFADLRIMALATIAITLERLASRPERVARAIGVVIIVAAATMLVRAFGPTAAQYVR